MVTDFSQDSGVIEPWPPLRDCWYLTGPTASGKTRVGLELAELCGAEIISLDSMAVYREMDLGTAKPTPAECARVPHHLINLVTPVEEFSLSQFVEAAHQAAAQIRDRGNQVLIVGGTPLYLKALLRGVFPGPPADWAFRRQIEEEVRSVGVEALHERLMQVDPLSAYKLHPRDKRRIIRALEVYKLTGRPLSHAQTQFDESAEDARRVFVLSWDREALHGRIESRVDQMFADGLVDEVRGLLERYGSLSRTASQAVGYREVIEHLENGCSLSEAMERVKKRTRQFARRQLTWFRSLSECRPVEMTAASTDAETASRIMDLARKGDGA